jgi:nitrite reductase/ring-hydroxylating ferredoxin subunit
MQDPRASIDPSVSGAAREGLTGTAPADLYARHDAAGEQITIAPDFRPAGQQPAWRQDFPIDWPQDGYVERRDFMKFMVLTSLAMTVGQFWIAAQNWIRGRRPPPNGRLIASLDALPIGGSLVFAYPGDHDNCLLVRLSETDLVAYNQKCTHLSCAVIPRPDQGDIHCPCHEGIFDLRTGRPMAGPPRRPLDRVTLVVHGRDVYATGIVARTV